MLRIVEDIAGKWRLLAVATGSFGTDGVFYSIRSGESQGLSTFSASMLVGSFVDLNMPEVVSNELVLERLNSVVGV